MKKLLLILVLGCSTFGFAQVVDVSSVKEISLPQNVESGYSTISPNGDFVLISDFGYNGLKKLDLSSNQLSVVSEAPGAGYDVKVLDNGNTVIYREKTINSKKLRVSSLKQKDLTTGKIETLVDNTRDLQGVSVKGNSIYTVKKGKLSTKTTKSGEKVDKSIPVMSIENGQLMMTLNGRTKLFSPNGTAVRYIWPSVSPDGSRILYYVSGNGAYVCDINGKNLISLGAIRAPKWYNSETIMGMNDIDDGHFTISSSIVLKTLDGTKQILTDSSVVAMYPSASLQGDKILFSTPAGKAYIININVKK